MLPSRRSSFYYYIGSDLHAVREGNWKLALPDRQFFYPAALNREAFQNPQLYDLHADVEEQLGVAVQHPEVVARLLALAQKARSDIGGFERTGANSRVPGSGQR